MDQEPVASTSALTLDSPPRVLGSASASSRSARPGTTFFRDARVCPDGSCALVASDDRRLSLFNLPPPVSGCWEPEWVYTPPDALLSFEWFPGATKAQPAMLAFAVGVKDHPVQLLDGSNHSLRASYPIVDHQERFVAPHSMAFALDGSKLYCGFENAIEVFDVSSPGHAGQRVPLTPTRSSKTGQKGIVSSLAFSPDHSGLLAVGSFSGTIGLYDTSVPSLPLMKLLKSRAEPNGVTKVAFGPGANLLYVASRLSDSIEVWDLVDLVRQPRRLARRGKTNQRMGFDLDPSGAWLVAGDTEGNLVCHAAQHDMEEPTAAVEHKLCEGVIGSVHFVPGAVGQLLVCSGSRSFDDALELDSSDDELSPPPPKPIRPRDSLRLVYIGPSMMSSV